MIAGATLTIAGIALRVYAKGSLQRDVRVCDGGAFRFLRHPFYLGAGLADLGLMVGSRAALTLPVWGYMYLRIARERARREEHRLAILFPEAWRTYTQMVPALIPSVGALATTEGAGFAWRRVVDEKEIHRSLRLAAALAWLVGFQMWLAPGGPQGHGWAGAMLALAAALRLAAHFVRKVEHATTRS